jgi:hypothetical protein
MDKFGNYLGPSRREEIACHTEWHTAMSIVDALNGTYVIAMPLPADNILKQKRITVQMGATILFTGKVTQLIKK